MQKNDCPYILIDDSYHVDIDLFSHLNNIDEL